MIPESLIPSLQGMAPSQLATCAPDGTPNLAYLSQVVYVDPTHVALSFQFFNKTIRNIRANPKATVQVIDLQSFEFWDLDVVYLRTETEGPLFDQMDMQLEAIASMTGMAGIFKLLGSDIYEVKAVRRTPVLRDAIAAAGAGP